MRILSSLLIILVTTVNIVSPSVWNLLTQQIKDIFSSGNIKAEDWFVTTPPPSPCPAVNASNIELHNEINDNPSDRFVLRAPLFNVSKQYEIVILVLSAEWEQQERRDIRRLWASVNESQMQKEGNSLVIFLVSRSSNLDKEAAAHGDLLQVDIAESYRNLVYKLEAGYLWLKNHIKFEFVLKTDSDSVVHIDRLNGRLRQIEKEQSGDWMACSRGRGYLPYRDTCSPWYVSYNDYPLSAFPDFCRGGGYAMKRATFDKIVESMGNYHVFEAEDVFFTGHVASNIDGLVIRDGITAIPYTDYSECDEFGPVVSILNTHHQLDSANQSIKNLAAAWDRLKRPMCHNFWTRFFNYK